MKKGKKGKGKEAAKLIFEVSRSRKADIPSIVKIIGDEHERSGAVIKVDRENVGAWIRSGISLVAKTNDGKIIGHMAANQWPESKYVELRSSVVLPEFRGNGVSTALTASIMSMIRKKYGIQTMVAFLNKAGNGMGILKAIGFREAEYGSLPAELFTIGPHWRGKKEYGYRILVLKRR